MSTELSTVVSFPRFGYDLRDAPLHVLHERHKECCDTWTTTRNTKAASFKLIQRNIRTLEKEMRRRFEEKSHADLIA